MKYRKILAMALSCVMAFSLAACGGRDGGNEKTAKAMIPMQTMQMPAMTRKGQTMGHLLPDLQTLPCGLTQLGTGGIPLPWMA